MKIFRNKMALTGLLLVAPLALVGCGSGEDGVDGKDGEDGANGQDGPKGTDGTDGENGADGEKGDHGRNGRDGEDGVGLGEDGVDGVDGVDGQDGRDGETIVGSQSLYFSPVAFPATDAEKSALLASPNVKINGTDYPLEYVTLARSGDVHTSGTFGLIVDEDGDPVLGEDASQFISNSADFSSILPVGNSLFAITHFESRPGGMYLSTLSQDATTGQLTVTDTKPIDFSEVDGLWVPCAGSVTPWGTHLGSEEYPTDAYAFESAADFGDYDSYFRPMLRYYGVDIYATTPPTVQEVNDAFNPYMIGYVTEVSVEEDGDYEVTKHYAMGRVAIELAYVMPDQKTAYVTDDGDNRGFYMFIADTAGDLSAGTLYAARWIQTSGWPGTATGGTPGSADLEWVNLGHATNAEIDAMIHTDDIQFSDIFDRQDMVASSACASGYTLIYQNNRPECLQLRSGMEKAASRLETARYAQLMGATMEMHKEEGITFDPLSNTLYLAISDIDDGMEDADSKDYVDEGGNDHIQLDANDCGAIYALDVAPSETIGSDYVALNMRGLVWGQPTNYVGTAYAGNTCSINGISQPDNVTVMPEYGVLIIGEDTGAHQNDVIWAYDLATEKLTRIQTTPYGSETTSPYWYPNVNGFGYLSSVVQHPYGESDQGEADDPSDFNAWVGYIGTFPATN